MASSVALGGKSETVRDTSMFGVSGAWMRGVVHAFEELGLDVRQLCASIDFEFEFFMDPANRLPRDSGGRLWRAALKSSGDRFLGLSAAEAWEARADSLVFLLLLSADTFGDGLTAGVRYQELLSHGRVLSLGEHDGYHAIQINRIENELPVTVHEIEFIAGILVKLFRFATDDAFTVDQVHFHHPFRGNLEQYTRVFDCPVKFGQEANRLLVDDATWALPVVHGNEALHGQLRNMAASLHAELGSHRFVDTVRDRIKSLLPRGNCGIETVASALHMTPRTLQRRLQEDGTTFRALMDATRKSIVLEGVERRRTADEIVRHAGYTNPRSFRRAMKRWNLPDPGGGALP